MNAVSFIGWPFSVNSRVPTRRIGRWLPVDVGIMSVGRSLDAFSTPGTLYAGSTG